MSADRIIPPPERYVEPHGWGSARTWRNFGSTVAALGFGAIGAFFTGVVLMIVARGVNETLRWDGPVGNSAAMILLLGCSVGVVRATPPGPSVNRAMALGFGIAGTLASIVMLTLILAW